MTNNVQRWLGKIAVAASLVCASGLASSAITYRVGVGGYGSPDPDLNGGVSSIPVNVGNARTAFKNGLVPVPYEEAFRKGSTQPNSPDTDLNEILGGMGALSAGFDGALDNTPLDNSGNFNGRWDTTGDASKTRTWFEFSTDVTIVLDALFDAFGFNLVDAGDIALAAQVHIDLYDAADNLVGSSLVGDVDNANAVTAAQGFSRALFFGVHSDTAFKKIVLRVNQDPNNFDPDEYDFLGIDDLILGNVARNTNPASAPGTLAIVGLGLLLASRASRRRR